MLFDGWPLRYAPASPPALHLFEILSALPAGVRPLLALPAAGGDEPANPQAAGENGAPYGRLFCPVYRPVADTPTGQLRWQQRVLPELARRVGAGFIHTTGARPPLFSGAPVIISPAVDLSAAPTAKTFAGRLADALGRGGLRGSGAMLWPLDLPAPPAAGSLHRLPPYAHSAFHTPQTPLETLPESYVLAPGALDDRALDLLSAAWSWAQNGLGEDWVLIACDLDDNSLERLRGLCQDAGVGGHIERVSPVTLEERAALFQQAGAVIALGTMLPWADTLLHALAGTRPLVAEESPLTDARAGPAAYLTAPGDARALGAALITVIVEEEVGEQLSHAARARAAAWDRDAFSRGLAAAYGIKSEAEPA